MAGDKAVVSAVRRFTTSVRGQSCLQSDLARCIDFTGNRSRASEGCGSPPPAIRRDTLVGHPHALGQFAGLPEHVDRDAAAWIPVAADAKPFRLDLGGNPLAD